MPTDALPSSGSNELFYTPVTIITSVEAASYIDTDTYTCNCNHEFFAHTGEIQQSSSYFKYSSGTYSYYKIVSSYGYMIICPGEQVLIGQLSCGTQGKEIFIYAVADQNSMKLKLDVTANSDDDGVYTIRQLKARFIGF